MLPHPTSSVMFGCIFFGYFPFMFADMTIKASVKAIC